jgi:hypothetical protein
LPFTVAPAIRGKKLPLFGFASWLSQIAEEVGTALVLNPQRAGV